jgi:hypothetical protein
MVKLALFIRMEESKYFNGNSMVNNLKETPFFCSPADSFYRP